MSVPTMRTVRSPFSCSARIRRALPGAPDALSRIVVIREVDPVAGEVAEQLVALRVEHRVHRLAHRLAGIDPDLRMNQQLQPLEPPARSSSCGQPCRQCWFESERYLPFVNHGACMTLTNPLTGSCTYSGSGLCQATTASKRSSRTARG